MNQNAALTLLAASRRASASPLEKAQPFSPEETAVIEKPLSRNRKYCGDDKLVVLKAYELKLRASGFDVICVSDGASGKHGPPGKSRSYHSRY